MKFLRYKPIYFLDSLFLTQFQAPLLHLPGAALLQGRSGLGGAGALVCSSPLLTLQVERRPAQRPGHLLPSPPSRLQPASALEQKEWDLWSDRARDLRPAAGERQAVMRIYPRVHSGRVQFSQPLEVIMDLAVFTQEVRVVYLGRRPASSPSVTENALRELGSVSPCCLCHQSMPPRICPSPWLDVTWSSQNSGLPVCIACFLCRATGTMEIPFRAFQVGREIPSAFLDTFPVVPPLSFWQTPGPSKKQPPVSKFTFSPTLQTAVSVSLLPSSHLAPLHANGSLCCPMSSTI